MNTKPRRLPAGGAFSATATSTSNDAHTLTANDGQHPSRSCAIFSAYSQRAAGQHKQLFWRRTAPTHTRISAGVTAVAAAYCGRVAATEAPLICGSAGRW
jgi:hypothetical protein